MTAATNTYFLNEIRFDLNHNSKMSSYIIMRLSLTLLHNFIPPKSLNNWGSGFSSFGDSLMCIRLFEKHSKKSLINYKLNPFYIGPKLKIGLYIIMRLPLNSLYELSFSKSGNNWGSIYKSCGGALVCFYLGDKHIQKPLINSKINTFWSKTLL